MNRIQHIILFLASDILMDLHRALSGFEHNMVNNCMSGMHVNMHLSTELWRKEPSRGNIQRQVGQYNWAILFIIF